MSNHDYRYKSDRELHAIKEEAASHWMDAHPLSRFAASDRERDVEDEFRRRRVEAERKREEEEEAVRLKKKQEEEQRKRWADEEEERRLQQLAEEEEVEGE